MGLGVACRVLCIRSMTRRRFVHQTPKQSSHSLAARLTGADRLPLDLSIALAVEVVEAVASAHQQRRSFAQLTAADLVVQPDGSVAITAPSVQGADLASNTFDVGAVLYQLFTGLTLNQARARLQVSPLHDVPPASRINPGLDDTLEGMLSLMLDRDPARRPHSLRVIEALLIDVCESLDLEPSRVAILHWASIAPSLRLVTPPPAPAVDVLADEDVISLDDEADSEDDADDSEPQHPGPLRFDAWAVAACAFCVVAFTMATRL